MKLELKHLAPYLPYGLRFISSMDIPFEEYGKNPIWTCEGVTKLFGDYCLTTPENNDAYAMQSCKPILRPLSDLTKEIEHNGEKFVPMEKAVTMRGSSINHLSDSGKQSAANALIRDISSQKLSYGYVEILISWHFDVFGLIEQGLAVDINTVNNG